VSHIIDNSSSISREQLTEAFLKALQLIDKRVSPLLGKATTRVLVQGAARRVAGQYPFLEYLITRPYTAIHPSAIQAHLAGATSAELAEGLNALLEECFAGLRELTGDLIAPPLHEEVTHELKQIQ